MNRRSWMAFLATGVVAAWAGCGEQLPGPGGTDAGIDEGVDAGPGDGVACEEQRPGPFVADAEPTALMPPVAGEVTIFQLLLPSSQSGESAVIVGPDGTIVLLDLGNTSHEDEVRAFVRDLNTTWLTPARGYRARTPLQVEWMVLTHFHGDHIGAFQDLMVTANEPLDLRKGVIHRGFVDVGDGMNGSDYSEVCDALTGSLKSRNVPLCEASVLAPCRQTAIVGAYEATACPGLHLGDLETPDDDDAGEPTRLSLGGCATLTLVAADGFVSDGESSRAVPKFGHTDSNEENARSLVGIVAHNGFRYHFGGDLTGAGVTGIPDIETHFAQTAGDHFYGPLGMDVIHSHHHSRKTSSNSALVGRLAPKDGASRNVIGGINSVYVGSPQAKVLGNWLDGGRLGNGWFWITESAFGADHLRLKNAKGLVVVRTIDNGRGYRMQASGGLSFSQAYPSVRQ